MTSLEVSITRQAVIAANADSTFAFFAAQDVAPKVLTGYGPLPAVVYAPSTSPVPGIGQGQQGSSISRTGVPHASR